MWSTEVLEKRAVALRAKRVRGELPTVVRPAGERNFNLTEAAAELGVSYSTARRMLAREEGVRRYSTTTAGDATVYPGQQLKRHQRVRMTYVIPEAVIARVKRRMGGVRAA